MRRSHPEFVDEKKKNSRVHYNYTLVSPGVYECGWGGIERHQRWVTNPKRKFLLEGPRYQDRENVRRKCRVSFVGG